MRILLATILLIVEILTGLAMLLSLVLLIVGWGIFITIPLLFFLVMNVRATANILANEAFSPRVYKLYTASIILAGLGCGFAEWISGHLSNLDTTGALDQKQFAGGLLVVCIFTSVLLLIAWYWQTSKKTL